MNRPLRLGYACSWWHPRETTWSYTPSSLLYAFSQEPEAIIYPIDAQRPLVGKASLAAGHAVLSRSAWQYGRINRRLTTSKVRRAIRRTHLDAVLAVGETEPQLSVPTFFYQDMGFGAALHYSQRLGVELPNLLKSSPRRLRQLASEQSRLYGTCAGIFTMGQWFADWLVDHGGVPQCKVHAIGGGLNAVPSSRRHQSDGRSRHRLLFVGRDFFRKGGDLVVDAVSILRATGHGPFTLTIVGPARWPLAEAPPSWVDFRGPMPPRDVSQLWACHDMLVLPSWFEAYGLTFLEARAAGLPCIARRAFAMPELVPDGQAGKLVAEHGGVDDVADAIYAVSVDDGLFERVGNGADQVVKDNSWSAVAARALSTIVRVVEPG